MMTKCYLKLLSLLLLISLMPIGAVQAQIGLNSDGEVIGMMQDLEKETELVKPGQDALEDEKSLTVDCVNLPAYSRTFSSGNRSRGYWFTAQSDFVITSLKVPTDVGTGPQSIQVVRMAAPPPNFSSTTSATTLFYVSNSTDDYIDVNIPITTGDIIGLLGVRGPGNPKNSYANNNTYFIDIAGVSTFIKRFGIQSNIANGPGNAFWTEDVSPVSRVEMCTTPAATELGCTGDLAYDETTGTHTLTSYGCYYGSPFTTDELVMNAMEMCGDGEIIAEVTSISGIGWAGITMRETLDPGSKKVQLSSNGSNFARREVRTTTNGPAYPIQFAAFGKRWLRLVRNGFQIHGYVSNNGYIWQPVLTSNVAMADCIYVGLTATGFNPNYTTVATFDNVSMGSPAPLVDNNTEQNLEGFNNQLGLEEVEVDVYPNPVAEQLNIRLFQMQDEAASLELMDANGQVLKSRQVTESTQLDVSDLPSGLYMLRIQSADQEPILRRVVVQ